MFRTSYFNNFLEEFSDLFESAPEQKKDENGNYQISLDVPGFNEKNLTVEMADSVLTIKGETDARKYFQQYIINQYVKNIEATIKDGVLTLNLIQEAPAEPKKIEFKTDVKQIE